MDQPASEAEHFFCDSQTFGPALAARMSVFAFEKIVTLVSFFVLKTRVFQNREPVSLSPGQQANFTSLCYRASRSDFRRTA